MVIWAVLNLPPLVFLGPLITNQCFLGLAFSVRFVLCQGIKLIYALGFVYCLSPYLFSYLRQAYYFLLQTTLL